MQPPKRLDGELLEAYMQSFFGYGSLSGAYWMIGIEERGGDTFEDVDARLRNWDYRGRLELEDVCGFAEQVGQGQWFGPEARPQRTWGNFIRVILSAEGIDDANDKKILQYQSEEFGRFGGETCLMILMPLPSQSSNCWSHANWSALPHLEGRKACMKYYAERRARRIKELVNKCGPMAVFLATMQDKYRPLWEIITSAEFEPLESAGKPFEFGRQGGTVFVVAHHPAARGVPKEYFREIGKCIAQREG